MPHCWIWLIVLFYLTAKTEILCQAEEDDDEQFRCSDYMFLWSNITAWIHLPTPSCAIEGRSQSNASMAILTTNELCLKLNDVCMDYKRKLISVDDDTNILFTEINMSHVFGKQSYRSIYFKEESCVEMYYAVENTQKIEPLQAPILLVCENDNEDANDNPELQTNVPVSKANTITPVYESRNNGVGSDNSTGGGIENSKSTFLVYLSYTFTGVAIVLAILTLSVCCVKHHKKRTRTLDNSNYDVEYNLTVQEDTPLPSQTEVNDNCHAEPTESSKVKLEFNNAIYNTSGLITKVIIQPPNKQISNPITDFSGVQPSKKTSPHQNGNCNGATPNQLSKSNKDLDKIGTSAFPSGEYQDFAVELKSKVRRVLSNPTYEDGVIRSPILIRPATTKSISNDKSSNLVNQPSNSESPVKSKHKDKQGHSSKIKQIPVKEKLPIQNSPDQTLNGVPTIPDKYPVIQPRDMSYMYVQLPKEWSQDVPIEEPTVPYASTDVTKTIYPQVPVKSKQRKNGRGMTEEEIVYETYDR